MKILTYLYLLIIPIMAYGQNCGEVLDCPKGLYPYRACKAVPDLAGGYARLFCLENPSDIPSPPYSFLRPPLPICIDPDLNSIDEYVDMLKNDGTTYRVFTRNQAIIDFNSAFYDWNCLCGKQNDNCLCTLSLFFSENRDDFPNPNSNLGLAGINYSLYECRVQCNYSYILINNTEEFTKKARGFPANYFINETFANSSIISDIKGTVYNLYDIVIHELGHILGFDHYEDCQSPSNNPTGQMGSIVQKSSGSSSGFSIHDKCMFKKLYCPNLVPVEETELNVQQESINYPNPFDDFTDIKVFVQEDLQAVEIRFYDQYGNELNSLSKICDVGENIFRFDFRACSSGVYYYVVKIGNRTEKHKMVLVK